MASHTDFSAVTSGGSEIKTHFTTREGMYKLMTMAEYSRPSRVVYNPVQQGQTPPAGQVANPPVRVNFVSLPSDASGFCDRICFNYGRELYFYVYKGAKKASDMTKPVDKRIYKGTSPTCHDINKLTVNADSLSLLVGFTGGQIQLIDPIKKELSKLFNEERLIDKTKVTCVKWLPGSASMFLASHASGNLYVYSEDLSCGGPTPPTYQSFKQGLGFAIYTCKTKSTRNPLYRWSIGGGAINEFAFSPCSKYLAIVSQDGFLRVFDYDAMELVGMARSYFGGFLCVCWSPDGQFVVTGGEDDLITVWSFQQKRIVARGQGHKSWVTVVTFDPFTSSYAVAPPSDSEMNGTCHETSVSALDDRELKSLPNCYRLGSVALDTQLCLWELTEDVLNQPCLGCRSRTSVVSSGSPCSSLNPASSSPPSSNHNTLRLTSTNHRLTPVEKKDDKGHKRNFSLGGKEKTNSVSASLSGAKSSTGQQYLSCCDPVKLIGSPVCPRLDEVPLLEPLVCKKVANERLTALVFREDSVITACQDGIICTWARPGIHEGTTV